MSTTITLPWPPSLNAYYRTVRGRILISSEGREYRTRVLGKCLVQRVQPVSGRLEVFIQAFPPDRRARDLDNLQKGLLDAITHAKVWTDDSDIDDLRIKREPVTAGGKVIVNIRSIA